MRRAHKGNFPYCRVYNHKGKYPEDEYGGLKLFATARWSDNNQFSTKAYYEELFAMIIHQKRPMEAPMMHHATKNCTYWGQVVYGGRWDERAFLKHLDGRHSHASNETRR
jgi:hypothetical protein